MRKVDFFILKMLLLFITLVWCFYLIESVLLAIGYALLFFIIELLILRIILLNQANPKTGEILDTLALKGQNYTQDIVFMCLNENIVKEKYEDHIIINNNGALELLYINIKFGVSSIDDIAKAIRIAEKTNAKMIHLLAAGVDRKGMRILFNQPYGLNIINIKKFIRAVDNKKLIQLNKKEKKGVKPLLLALASALNRKNASRFLLISLVTIALSFITPLKIYYMIAATVLAIIALLCYIKPIKDSVNSIF